MKSIALVVCLLLSASAVFGQTALGTITGTVTDPSGAVIPNADITASNTANGQVYRAVSTDTGNYTIPQLPVGTYNLSIVVKGFKTYNREKLELQAAQIMRIDVPLSVGSQAESVTVTTEASLLKTESGDLVHNVTDTELNELPIMSVGGTFQANTSGYRDPLALAKLVPGIQYSANSQMVINGVPASTEQIRVEGQVSGDTSGLRLYTAIGQAGADAVQEVAVQTSNFAAEFGTTGGGIFNMTMKSGTNQLHGGVSDYFADDLLNASQPYTGLKTATKRHDYDFNVGGPVIIPKLYNGTNKSFFFFSFEEFRENALINSIPAGNPTVPTPAYRNGDFTQAITGLNNTPFLVNGKSYVDPLGRSFPDGTIFDPNNVTTVTCNTAMTPTPNCNNGTTYQVRNPYATSNVIPSSAFDPVSLRILNLVPSPTGIGFASGQLGGNFQNPFVSQTRAKIPTVKGDQSFGSKTHVSFYGGATLMDAPFTVTNGNAEGFPVPISGARSSDIYTKTFRGNFDYTVSPTMLLHIGGGWYGESFNDYAADGITYAAEAPQVCTNTPTFGGLLPLTCTGGLGLTGARVDRQFPLFTMSAPTTATGGMSSLGTQFGQSNSKERRPSGVANMTWVKGNHNYKIGGEWRLERYPIQAWTNTTGSYTFGASQSAGIGSTIQTALQGVTGTTGSDVYGFSFADFLRGDVSSYTIAQPGASATRKQQTALFIQDTWKVTRKFTLDYGLRWDYATYGKDENGILSNFSPTTPNPSAAGHPGAQIYEATCNCHFASNYPYALGPRVGLAYQINSKTVFRGGVGLVYAATQVVGSSAGNNSATTPALTYGGIAGQLQNGIPNTLVPVFPNLAANAGQVVGGVVAAPSYLDPNEDKPARQLQYSASLQRELNRNLVVEASYVGNRGVWWPAGGLTSLNAMSVGLLNQEGFQVGNTQDSQALVALESSVLTSPTLSSYLATKPGFTLTPYSNFPTTQSVRQSLLPYPQYTGTISPSGAPLGKTWYDALQVVVTKRLSHGLTLNANYSYSKTLSLMSSPDVFNPILGKAYSTSDLPHQFRLSAEYRTPRLKGSGFLGNKVVSAVLADWAIGTYLQYQSAPMLGLPASAGLDPISNYLGRGPGPSQLVPGISPWAVNWVDSSGKVHPEPIDVNCRCFDPTRPLMIEQTDPTTGQLNGVFKPGTVLNPAAWTNVPAASWSNNYTTDRAFRGIRLPTENLNFGRTFRIKERVSLQLRVEFANAFNRVQLPQPTSTSNQATTLTTQTTPGIYQGAITGGFGAFGGGFTPLPQTGTSGYRTGLFVGRLTF